jgi:prolipoprotein diacylglyceryltransferase
MRKFIPTPSSSTLELGFFTFHFYALAILLGIFVAVWVTKRRYKALGGNPDDITDLALVVVPAGIIGGRIYHVLTSPQKYFGENGSPIQALQIWRGGLGIWGAISIGALAAFIFFIFVQFIRLHNLDEVSAAVVTFEPERAGSNLIVDAFFAKLATLAHPFLTVF